MQNQEHHNALGVILQVTAKAVWAPEWGGRSESSHLPDLVGAAYTHQGPCPLLPSFPSRHHHFMPTLSFVSPCPPPPPHSLL